MATLGSGSGSGYPGAIDTAGTEVDSPNVGKTLARAAVPNDIYAALVALMTALGTNPAGALSDVKTFLQTQHNTDGTHKASTFSGNITITLAQATVALKESGGASARMLAEGGGGTNAERNHITSNMIWNGTQWNRDDTSRPAWDLAVGGSLSDNMSISRAASGANPASPTTLVTFDNTGKITAGIVPLARMAYITDVTFTSIGTGAYGDQTITHSLGTDNVMCLMMIDGSWTNSIFMARRPDGRTAFCQIGSPAAYVLPAAPSTGQIAVRFRNESGITVTAVCRVAVLRES